MGAQVAAAMDTDLVDPGTGSQSKAEHTAALGPADASSPTHSPFVSRQPACCPILTAHEQSRPMDHRAGWPSPRARPGLRVTLPMCLPLGRLPPGKWTWGCSWKDHPQGLYFLLSSQTVPGEGRPGKDWGREPHCTPCGPKKAHVPSWNSKGYPSRQTVLGRMEAEVSSEHSAVSWGLRLVHWGPGAPHSLRVH